MPDHVPAAPPPAPSLRLREFHKFRELAYRHFGLDLSGAKHGLVASRLGRAVRELGLRSFADYYSYVESDASGAALTNLVDRLTTNHTGFFREPAHFEFLRKTVFPRLRERSRIHIWSAACSTGEEPYSIAMSMLEEAPREAQAKLRIKATDISTAALARARTGSYPSERVATLPAPLPLRYLEDDPRSAGRLRFPPRVRDLIDFDYLNLMAPLPAGYRCSVLFCRNVMIYFDRPTRQSLIQRLSQHLEAGGYLFIGHAETLHNISHTLEYVCPSIYRKPVQLPPAGSPGCP